MEAKLFIHFIMQRRLNLPPFFMSYNLLMNFQFPLPMQTLKPKFMFKQADDDNSLLLKLSNKCQICDLTVFRDQFSTSHTSIKIADQIKIHTKSWGIPTTYHHKLTNSKNKIKLPFFVKIQTWAAWVFFSLQSTSPNSRTPLFLKLHCKTPKSSQSEEKRRHLYRCPLGETTNSQRPATKNSEETRVLYNFSYGCQFAIDSTKKMGTWEWFFFRWSMREPTADRSSSEEERTADSMALRSRGSTSCAFDSVALSISRRITTVGSANAYSLSSSPSLSIYTIFLRCPFLWTDNARGIRIVFIPMKPLVQPKFHTPMDSLYIQDYFLLTSSLGYLQQI